jgi:hypothetical protein
MEVSEAIVYVRKTILVTDILGKRGERRMLRERDNEALC